MAVDARNFATDTKLVVHWDPLATPSQWEWQVITQGTVGVGGTLPNLFQSGNATSLKVAIDKGAEKMMQAVPLDVIGAGTTFHRTAAGVIRTGISTLGPTGFVGARGAWLTTEKYTRNSIKGKE